MSDVFVTTYQVVGDGVAVAKAHFDEFERIQETHFTFMKERGALAYRQGFDGRVRSLFFDADQTPPAGYRGTGGKEFKAGKWVEEKIPHRGSKNGKALQVEFECTARLPSANDLVEKFGWLRSRVHSGNRVFFPTLCRVDFPEPGFFVRLPRQADDGWPGHPNLTAIPEDSLMSHLDAHNQLAKEAA